VDIVQDKYSLSLPIAELGGEPSPLKLVPRCRRELREYIEQFALHFKREKRMDCLQFCAADIPGDADFIPWEAYLFHEMAADLWTGEGPVQRRIFGGACFRWRERENAATSWELDWVWFHPYFRSRGHLKKAWSMFEQTYGVFPVARPLSPSMKAFLEKAGWDAA
jgi:hypothetical protein